MIYIILRLSLNKLKNSQVHEYFEFFSRKRMLIYYQFIWVEKYSSVSIPNMKAV